MTSDFLIELRAIRKLLQDRLPTPAIKSEIEQEGGCGICGWPGDVRDGLRFEYAAHAAEWFKAGLAGRPSPRHCSKLIAMKGLRKSHPECFVDGRQSAPQASDLPTAALEDSPERKEAIAAAVRLMLDTDILCPVRGDQVSLGAWLDGEATDKIFRAGLAAYKDHLLGAELRAKATAYAHDMVAKGKIT